MKRVVKWSAVKPQTRSVLSVTLGEARFNEVSATRFGFSAALR